MSTINITAEDKGEADKYDALSDTEKKEMKVKKVKKEAEEIAETYIQKYDRMQLERKQDKEKSDEQYNLDDADAAANELDKFIQKTVKTVSVATLSERDQIPYWIDTDSVALNWIISNSFFKGLPGTKAIMIAGDSGKGKSLLLDVFLGNNIRKGGVSYKFDIEDAGGHDFTSKVVGSEKVASKIRLITPKNINKETKNKHKVITIEKLNAVLNGIINFQTSSEKKKRVKSVVAGIDSVTQLTTIKEIEDNIGDKGKKDMTSTQKIREMFRVITQQQKQSNLTLIGLAQMTANIGVMFGPKKVENAKGSGFKYASSLNLQATTDKELTKSVKGGAEIPIGIKMRFKTTKNRVEFKGRDSWIYFYFNKGVDKYGGLIELLSQYGVFKASSTPTVYGEYKDTTTFVWVHPDTGEKYQFGFSANKKGRINFKTFMNDLIEAEDFEAEQELLTIWNYQLNEIYADMTSDWDDAVLLESDDADDEDFEEEDDEDFEEEDDDE